MSTAPITAQPADRTAHHRDVLDGLIDLGHELAREIVGQTKSHRLPAADAAIAFDRITRSVRRCIALYRKLAEPIRTVDRIAARKRIIRAVEDAIQREADSPEAESLREELLDRLDTPDLDDDIDNRPVADIITEICRDLGIDILPGAHPWKRRTPTRRTYRRTRRPGRAAGSRHGAPRIRPPARHAALT